MKTSKKYRNMTAAERLMYYPGARKQLTKLVTAYNAANGNKVAKKKQGDDCSDATTAQS
ncbi:MAG: hypothetical protein L3J83_10870 [Proteobacteria bacterium]|nr:hypothetical protein [Pseudomonadota bacterium]